MEESNAEKKQILKVDSAMGKIMKDCSYASAASLLVMAVWATVNVIYSNLTKTSIPSTTDWIAYLLIPAVYLSAAAEILDRGLVYVDLITQRFAPIVEKIILFASYLVGVGISILLAVQQYRLTIDYFQKGKISSVDKLHFPIWPFTLIFGIGLTLMAVAMMWYAIRIPAKIDNREPADKEEGDELE